MLGMGPIEQGPDMHSNSQRSASEQPQSLVDPTAGAREIEDFIYLISHDVRASVRALLELPQWIVEDLEEAGVKLDGPIASSIDLMNRHTGRLDRMLVDLLTYSRVGRMQETSCQEIDVVLDSVLDEIKLPIGFVVTRDLKCTHAAMGDRDFLTLLDALIQNAFKHHHKSSGRIHVSSATEGAETVISVADDGPGIAPENREKVFGAMQTLRPRDEVEGSGMGLAIARKIALTYGGSAQVVRSVFGRGTTIEVRVRRSLS